MKRFISILAGTVILFAVAHSSLAVAEDAQWAVFEGKEGPGKGKHIVFVTGDDEYFSEECMPIMARILAEKHGFKCTVLFAINKTTGVIDVGTKDNIPGLEALDKADLMVIFTRFRSLPDDQMKHVVDYADSGRPIIGLRTATHAFNFDGKSTSSYKKYTWTSKEPGFEGGFGRLILGETWINHFGHHGKESTRGIVAPGMAEHPILRGIKDGDIWGPTDVYEVRQPFPEDNKPLILGQVLTGMDPKDPPAPATENPKTKKTVDKNNPMLPVAWIRTYTGAAGKPARIFASTMGGSMSGKRDFDSEGMRRLLVNACYWCVGLEDKIPAKSDVEIIGKYDEFKKGTKPH